MTFSYRKIMYLLPLFFCLLLEGCSSQSTQTQPLVRTEFVFGTLVQISIYDSISENIGDNVLDLAIAHLEEIESLFSLSKTDTLINKVNAQAGISPVVVDEGTFNLIEKSLYYNKLTDGLFDITLGPLTKLWAIGSDAAHIPSSSEITGLLPLIDSNYVILDEVKSTVFLEKKGMMLDLGGIAKGFAADEIRTLLQAHNVEHAVIDIGGNLLTLGTNTNGTPWRLGIQNPFNPRGNIIGYLPTSNQSLVTSGTYERYIEDEAGRRYHHLLNPKTGYPFDNDLVSVTVLCNSSTDGDALSTAAFSLGLTEGLALLEDLRDTEGIFITTTGSIYLTSGLDDLFVLTDSDFTLHK